MDSLDSQEKKKIHFSIGTFPKKKALTSIIQIEDEQKKEYLGKYKRSSSYVIPKKFVPRIRPRKTSVNPSYFILNKSNDIQENEKNKEKTETKSVKEDLSNDEDSSSFCSLSDSETEEKTVDKFNYLDEYKYKNNKNNSLSSLFSIRKKLQQIKHNFCLLSKECIDLNFSKLRKKYSIDYDVNNNYRELENINNDTYNYNKYKFSMIFTNNKYKSKNKPFLIFDVLAGASQRNNYKY